MADAVCPFAYDVGVVGLGRVGLPLALCLAEAGLRVLGFEINRQTIESVRRKTMPFLEKGCDELIRKVPLEATDDMSRIASVEHIIVTVGTPLRQHIEADTSQLESVVEGVAPYIQRGHNVILRSTVAPRTTDLVRKRLEQLTGFKSGNDFYISFCPERIAEGKALEELRSLPQIIGAEDGLSYEKAAGVFRTISPETLRTDTISAELAKLFTNISRYVHFALSNQFAIVAEQFGASIFEIVETANYKYPRGSIANPGFTAGTCLRKDFGMINELNPYSDMLLDAWKINEYMPKFLVDSTKRRTELSGKKIAILGYTFKQDTDDPRDSLVPKLYRYIKREAAFDIAIHEPHLSTHATDPFNSFQFLNGKREDILSEADIVFVAVNHRAFQDNFPQIAREIRKPDAWIVDLWNVSGMRRVHFQKKEFEGRSRR